MDPIKDRHYTEEQRALLMRPVPMSPCINCPFLSSVSLCQECEARAKYQVAIQPYKDAQIFDVAIHLQYMQDLKNKIKNLCEAYAQDNEKLPEFLRRNTIVIDGPYGVE